jgi:DNA-binding beta-propeller fold protein YncE
VLKFDSGGQLLGSKNSAGDTILGLPTGITVRPDGKVFVVDTEANTVVDLGSVP